MLALLANACLATRSVFAEVNIDEYEPTPTTLGELVGEVDEDSIAWDVWYVDRQGGQAVVFSRSLAFVRDGVVVFVEFDEILRSEMSASVALYSLDGKLIEHRLWARERDQGTWEEHGEWFARFWREGTTEYSESLQRDGVTWRQRKRQVPAESELIPHSWIPLAIRYHIAQGHERFRLGTYHSASPPHETRWEPTLYQDLGVERIAVNGEEKACHIFETTDFTTRDGGEVESLTRYWVCTMEGLVVHGYRWALDDATDGCELIPPGTIPEGFEGSAVVLENDIGDAVFGAITMEAEAGDDDAE